MSPRALARPLVLFVSLLFGGLLAAQSYQTSFSEVKFDRVKGPGSIHGGVEVEAATGALSQTIPFGPGIGAKGAHFTPTFSTRLSPQWKFQGNPAQGVYGLGYHASLSPGYLDIPVDPVIGSVSGYSVAGGPSSESVYFNQAQGFWGQADLSTILPAFGYSGRTGTVKGLGSKGELVVYLDATQGEWINLPSWGEPDPVTNQPEVTCHSLPKTVLLISAGGETAYEFTFVQGVYQNELNLTQSNPCLSSAPPNVEYQPNNHALYAHYLITAIANRFSDSIRFDWRPAGSFNGIDYRATWFKGGASTGIGVDVRLTGTQGAPNIPAFKVPSQAPTTLATLRISYLGVGQSWYEFQAYPQRLNVFVGNSQTWGGSSSRPVDHFLTALQPERILVGDTGEFIHYTYGLQSMPWGGETVSVCAPSSVEFNHRRIDLSWAEKAYHVNVSTGSWAGYEIATNGPSQSWMFGVVEIRDRSLTDATTRTTRYERVVPVPVFNSTNTDPRPYWSSTDFWTARINPDNSVDAYIYASPINGSTSGPTASESDQLRTIAHLKHILLEERSYAPNVSWAGDLRVAPGQSSAFRITRHGNGSFSRVNGWNNPDWAFHSMLSPRGEPSWEPYPIRTEVWEKDPGTARYIETTSQAWDEDNAAWTRQVSTVNGGNTRSTNTTYMSAPASWLWRQPQVSEQTGQPPVRRSFNANGTVNRMVINEGGSPALTLAYLYNGRPDPTEVTLSSVPALFGSGQSGALYRMDALGFLDRIQLKGVAWAVTRSNDALGRPLTQTDPAGRTTSFTWDSVGRLTGIAPPTPELPTQIAYPDLLTARVSRGESQVTYHYDGFGQLTSVDRPGGSQSFLYDNRGRKRFESIWGNASKGTTFEYEGQGRIKKTTDPNNLVTTTTYAPLRRTVTVDPQGLALTTTFTYDPLGRLAGVTDAEDQATSYEYDDGDRILAVQQTSVAGSQTRTWHYNPLGWLDALSQPESGTTSYSNFTVLGKPQSTSYAGRTVQTTYDLTGRVQGVNAVDGSVQQAFAYDQTADSQGKLSQSTDGEVTTKFTYSGLNGRLGVLETSLPLGPSMAAQTHTQRFTYNNYGFRDSSLLPSGRALTFAYDAERGVGTGVSSGGTALAAINGFNPADLPTRLTLARGLQSTFSYSQDQSRLAGMAHWGADGASLVHPASTWTYAYDGAGRLTSDGTDDYTYDRLSRLIRADVKLPSAFGTNQALTQTFSYDAFGNQTKSSVANIPSGLTGLINNFEFSPSHSAWLQNRLPSVLSNGASTGVQYDPQGNLIQVWKQAGDSSKAVNLFYDALGRVTQMTDSDPAHPVTEKYFYTAEGLRTRIETWQGGALQKVQIKLYNDQRQLVSEYEAVAQ